MTAFNVERPSIHGGPGAWLGLPLTAALLYILAFPPFDLGILAALAPLPIAFLTIAPTRRLGFARALAAGLLFGTATALGVTGHWMFLAASNFFGKPVWFSAAFTISVTFIHVGLFFAVIVVLASGLGRLAAPWRVLALPSLWVACEFARSNLLYGCPWDLLGHAFYGMPRTIQATDLAGVWLLSWTSVATCAALATAYFERANRRTVTIALSFAIVLPLAIIGYGQLRLNHDAAARSDGDDTLAVAIVQANIGRHELWDKEHALSNVGHYLELSRSPELSGADLIVWPESSIPFFLGSQPDVDRRIRALASESGAAVLASGPRSVDTGDGRARIYNSVFFFPPDGGPPLSYDKRHLLPYLEFRPPWLGALGYPGDAVFYMPGETTRAFNVRGWNVAPLICLEAIFPSYARRDVGGGADLILNLSNDSWFGDGAGLEQHFAMTVFRAVENHVPLVRVASTGVSAAIDSSGRIVNSLPTRRQAVRLVRVRRGPGSSPYMAWGDWFAWCCLLLAALSVAASLAGSPAQERRRR